MELFEVLKSRYSCRAYRPDSIEPAHISQLLEAVQLAPTACNRQPFEFVLIHTEGRKEELSRIYAKDWFVQAPLIVAACGLVSSSWVRRDGKNYNDVDVAIAMDHFILAAASLGLGTCWVANFDPAAAREILGLPSEVEPVLFTPLGYPDDSGRPKMRKSLEKLVRYERW